MGVRRCPTFPPGLGSIIGAGWLSFRVRDGSGRFPAAMAAVTLFHTCGVGVCLVVGCRCCLRGVRGCEAMFFYNNGVFVLVVVSFRPVSASSLQLLLVFQVWSIDPVFCGGPYPT